MSIKRALQIAKAVGGQAGGAGGGEYRLQMQKRAERAEGGPVRSKNKFSKAIEEAKKNYDHVGLRTTERPMKSSFQSSHVWEDGKRTSKRIDGVSVTDINHPHAFAMHRLDPVNHDFCYYPGDYIHVLGSNQIENGKDPGELVMKNPTIVARGRRPETYAEGGSTPAAPAGPKGPMLHVGPIHSPVAGRTDHLPMHVPSGSYVLPADIVSAHGEGNSMAGFKVMRRIFGGTPYHGGKQPYGHQGGPYGRAGAPYDHAGGPYGEKLQGHARGGEAASVPIIAAGGEYVLSPAQVRAAGGGDLDMGHRVLDEFVKRSRRELIKTLQKLPGPVKD